MAKAYIGVGSNISPAQNVKAALRRLRRQTRVRAISTVYCSAAEGRPEQPPYLNCVVEIETAMAPMELKQSVLRPIEYSLGRLRTADKYAARTIDLDLIVYDDLQMEVDGLILPDPQIKQRAFLALPLSELAPEMMLFGLPIEAIAAQLSLGAMEPLMSYTERLRKDMRRETDRYQAPAGRVMSAGRTHWSNSSGVT